MFCQKCGNQLAMEAAVCGRCGTAVARPGQAAGAAADKVKAASKDALGAFRRFVSDPVGGFAPACESLQPGRTLGVGIVFGVAFILLLSFGIKLGAENLPFFGMGIGLDNFFLILVGAAVPFVSLAAAAFGLRSIARGRGGLGEDAFVAGGSLLPFGFAVFLSGLLGLGNLEVIGILFVFALCFTVMMLFAGTTRIYGLSERLASIGVPVMVLLSGWLSKVIYTALIRSQSPY